MEFIYIKLYRYELRSYTCHCQNGCCSDDSQIVIHVDPIYGWVDCYISSCPTFNMNVKKMFEIKSSMQFYRRLCLNAVGGYAWTVFLYRFVTVLDAMTLYERKFAPRLLSLGLRPP